MKRISIRRLSVVSAFVLVTSLCGYAPVPAIEAERLRIPMIDQKRETL